MSNVQMTPVRDRASALGDLTCTQRVQAARSLFHVDLGTVQALASGACGEVLWSLARSLADQSRITGSVTSQVGGMPGAGRLLWALELQLWNSSRTQLSDSDLRGLFDELADIGQARAAAALLPRFCDGPDALVQAVQDAHLVG